MFNISQKLWEDLVHENMILEDLGEEITKDHIKKKFKRYKIDDTKAGILITALKNRHVIHDDLYLSHREDNLKSQIKALKKDSDKLKKTIDSKNLIIRRYQNVTSKDRTDIDSSYVVKTNNSKKSKNDVATENEAVAYVIFSDLHYEENVIPEETYYDNEYTPEIAHTRCMTMVDNSIKLLEKERMTSNIDTMVFAIIGDVITGRIHDELIEGNSVGAATADNQVVDLILKMIYRLADEGNLKEMIIPCVRGNHGRTTIKRSFGKMSFENSRETMIYLTVKRALENEQRFIDMDCNFKLIVEKSDYTYINVYGKDIRFAHGDDVKFSGGVGGISPSLMKWLSRQNAHKFCEMTFIGHFHQIHLEIAPNIMANGSIIGSSAYSKKFEGRKRPPQQIFCIQDKMRGFTIRTHLDVIPDDELMRFYKSL